MFLTMHVAGHLDCRWSEWFEGLDMRHLPDGSTELSGTVRDQTALYGLLNRARDLGLTMLEVSVEQEPPAGERTEDRPHRRPQ